MPPSGGAPQGPQGSPPAGPGQQPGQDVVGLLKQVEQALDHLNMVFSQSGAVSPKEKQMMDQINQMYEQMMSSLGQDDGSDDDTPGNGQGQTVPPEAGGNKGAIPSPM